MQQRQVDRINRVMYPPPQRCSPNRNKIRSPPSKSPQKIPTTLNSNPASTLRASNTSKTPVQHNFQTSPNSKLTNSQIQQVFPPTDSNQAINQQQSNCSNKTIRAHNGSQRRGSLLTVGNENLANQESQRSQIHHLSGLRQVSSQVESRAQVFSRETEQNQNDKTITVSKQKKSQKHSPQILDTFDTMKALPQDHKQNTELIYETTHVQNLNLNHIDMNQEVTRHNIMGLNDSMGSLEHHPHIWNADEYQLNDEQVSNLCYKEEVSEQNERSQHLQLQPSKIHEEVADSRQQIYQKNSEKSERSQLSEQLTLTRQLKHQLQQKSHEYEMLKAMNYEKYQDIQEQHKELNNLIQEYKQKAYQNQMTIKKQTKEICALNDAIDSLKRGIQRKDQDIAELHMCLTEKQTQIYDLNVQMKELEEFFVEKKSHYDRELTHKYQQIACLNETITFYQERLDEDGYNFSIDQMKHLKDLFLQQVEKSKQIKVAESQYKKMIKTLEREKDNLQKLVKTMKKQIDREGDGKGQQRYEQLMKYTQQIVEQYDVQLGQRDEQIIALKTQLTLNKDISLHHCEPYLKQVKNLTSLITDKLPQISSTQLAIQFVYIVDKLCNMFMMAQRRAQGLEKYQSQMGKLMQEKEKLHEQELEAAYWELEQIGKENQGVNQKYQELRVKYNALLFRKSGKKQVVEKDQEEQEQSLVIQEPGLSYLASSMIVSRQKPEESQLRHESCSLIKINDTLEEILCRKFFPENQKLKLSIALIEFAQKMLKQHKKPLSFKPSEISISTHQGKYTFELIKNINRRSRQSQKSLFYAAPEVLLGFAQSEQSYIWTVGLVMDELFHNSCFYKKINLITCRQENYECRDGGLPVRDILMKMMKKKQKERPSMKSVRQELVKVMQK